MFTMITMEKSCVKLFVKTSKKIGSADLAKLYTSGNMEVLAVKYDYTNPLSRFIDQDGKMVGSKYGYTIGNLTELIRIQNDETLLTVAKSFRATFICLHGEVKKIDPGEHKSTIPKGAVIITKPLVEETRPTVKRICRIAERFTGKASHHIFLEVLGELYAVHFPEPIYLGKLKGREAIDMLACGECFIVARKISNPGSHRWPTAWVDCNDKKFAIKTVSINYKNPLKIEAADLVEKFIENFEEWFQPVSGGKAKRAPAEKAKTVSEDESFATYARGKMAELAEQKGIMQKEIDSLNAQLNVLDTFAKREKGNADSLRVKLHELTNFSIKQTAEIKELKLKTAAVITDRATVELNKMMADEKSFSSGDIGAVIRFCLRTGIMIPTQVPKRS